MCVSCTLFRSQREREKERETEPSPTPPDFLRLNGLEPSFDDLVERKEPLMPLALGACDVSTSDDDLSELLPDWFLQGSTIVNSNQQQKIM